MARKKTAKRGRKAKDPAPEHELPGGFWRQVMAVLMLALAVFFVMTWFGSGGELLNNTDAALFFVIGYAKFLVPVLLVYLAIRIFRSPDNRLPIAMWLASILMICWAAGVTGIPTIGAEKPTGGVLGGWLNSLATKILDPGVAVFIYVVLIFITALFILQLSPKTVFKGLINLFKSNKKEDSENAKIARAAEKAEKTGDLEITVNSGVATVDNSNKKLKVNTMKSAPAAKPAEEKALVSVSDPDWKMPSLDLLEKKQSPADPGNHQQNAFIIKSTLAEFGIDVEMEGANVGPRVTQYTMKPPAGVNLSKILARDKELALNLAVDKIRIEAPIPGTRSVGVEIPNVKSADVRLRGILESDEWKTADDPLTFAVGKDISGKSVVANLAKMPHLLIAGTTGSGKSVMTNTLISSLLYRNAPSDMKLIIVDPKQVEMVQYNDIPHLLTPIITSVDKALSAMKWAVNEMERRYTLMAEEKVKNIVDYNKKMAKKAVAVPDEDGNEQKRDGGKMPYIVVVIDEMADLMMMAGKDLEMLIVRVAQKGRAAGIHLVLATQRPEVKVITGLIKANIPGRIAFAVGSQMDSRIMLDMGGAEKLLGKGDMLMLTTEMMGKPRRIQGAWASDEDVNNLADFLREQRPPDYNDDVISQAVQIKGFGPADGGAIGDLGRKYDPTDPIVRKAVEITLSKGKFSTAMLQTYLGKGHGFVSGLAIWLEQIGVIGEANGNKPREVKISSMEEFDELAGA
ncbi:DNA translocase FtsK 4TM domain-containing protein [Candidatus Saccharibacteria bacterium]|nr:DNA translocase FtsK 4TM domain-containing protein [Candidatus Saccharibacteria bacterium]